MKMFEEDAENICGARCGRETGRGCYHSVLTDAGLANIAPLVLLGKRGGDKCTVIIRDDLNGLPTHLSDDAFHVSPPVQDMVARTSTS
jgi:hypothetical protein